VRRAFLCGRDPHSGKDYEYRRDWICQFEEKLAGLFAVEVGFHAELSNHLHVVLRNRPDVAARWTDKEVARRWLAITHLVKSKDGELKEISAGQIAIEMADPERGAELRKRLADPSFFMATLCEHVARRSNREDGCSGSFWDGRFKCRALLDEAAILVCGIYVDLNQIRAGEAQTPETSTHTSAHDRIAGRRHRQRQAGVVSADCVGSLKTPDGWLCELTLQEGLDADVRGGIGSATGRRASDKGLLPITLDDYLQLLDTSGRIVREGKSGSILAHLAPILQRLGIKVDLWSELVTLYHEWFGHVVGASPKLVDRAAGAGRRWYWGQPRCVEAFG
jgi:hypothetical protein